MRPIDADKIEYTNTGYAEKWRIDRMPTLNPVRRGAWITDERGHCECSECHKNCPDNGNFYVYTRFCPSCGSDNQYIR